MANYKAGALAQASRIGATGMLFLCLSLATASAAQIECKAVPGFNPPPPKVVHFATNSTEVAGDYRKQVIELAERYTGNPTFLVCLTGQADKQGNAAYNDKLALRRAKAIGQLMEKHGIKASQIIARTRGEAFSDALGGGDNEADRRVEIKILSR